MNNTNNIKCLVLASSGYGFTTGTTVVIYISPNTGEMIINQIEQGNYAWCKVSNMVSKVKLHFENHQELVPEEIIQGYLEDNFWIEDEGEKESWAEYNFVQESTLVDAARRFPEYYED